MRTRKYALEELIKLTINNLPKSISLEQIDPLIRHSSWGIIEYGHYNFIAPLQKIPSTHGGRFINDAMYMHGGSHASWLLAEEFCRFTTKVVCMDTGIPANIRQVYINSKMYKLGSDVDIELNGRLEISTDNGPGTHIAFLEPKLHIKVEKPNIDVMLSSQ